MIDDYLYKLIKINKNSYNKQLKGRQAMKMKKIRDLILVDIDEEKTMVIACDSSGSIGEKENDVLKVSPFITGKYCARVGLLEIISTNAEVIAVIDNVCNEMYPTGEQIIKGIEEELACANLIDVALGGSTEENFPSFSTALGVTVIGMGRKQTLKINNVQKDGLIYSVGLPKVGGEINIKGDEEIIEYNTLMSLLGLHGVMEIVPVGSKGILYEAKELAKYNNKEFILSVNEGIDIYKSAGPATCIIIAIDKSIEGDIKKIPNSFKIGELI